jgi:hypothetical protein
MTRLHSYLNFAGNAEEAFGFYRSVFAGDFPRSSRFKDLPMEGLSIPWTREGAARWPPPPDTGQTCGSSTGTWGIR